jgi:carbonic anhydrase
MRLFEAIFEVNQRRVAGDKTAVLPVAEFGPALPVAALTCIDPRLNRLLPDMLGLPEDKFVWLRNAGNIITSPFSSTMRSLSLACAIKGAKEIALIGHSDCLVGKATAMNLLHQLQALGVDRGHLPENLVEFFGLFGSERQNVIRGVDFVRVSPLIGAKIPVHGILIDIDSGRLEWVVNGYQGLEAVTAGKVGELFKKADPSFDVFAKIGNAATEELKLPETKIGETIKTAGDWLRKAEQITGVIKGKTAPARAPKAAESPPRLPPRPGGR